MEVFDEFGERYGRPWHNRVAPRTIGGVHVLPEEKELRGDSPQFQDCMKAANLYITGSPATKKLVWDHVFKQSPKYQESFRSMAL